MREKVEKAWNSDTEVHILVWGIGKLSGFCEISYILWVIVFLSLKWS